ncbi:hypothetical protein NEMBOFW57_010054 [Staphylotrichum longicolle]|uniref:Box C/D snoRNA protein 1 n=1 Tax=Staphylotrichum longicolle TaxID=669026 RepID=A0AAD4ETU8_9PEZI|nr:hypothetical protein NEMBOFW57_010054 [Staphylotrichum longicolle]
MSETVLSTLCSICHTEPPKYRCPRCGARTCSVGCIQKHKARADCDGVRNPRAFLPLAQLKTDAGIDHDFNFLTSIERARQRAEKDVVEVRQLLSDKELRPPNDDKLFQKVWYGDELHHIPAQQSQSYGNRHGRAPAPGPPLIDGFDKHVRRRLRYLDIEAVTMPKGMARQRDNKTAWNRRTQTINWQVEWLVYNAADLGFVHDDDDDQQQPLRILYKSLEGTPLAAALASTLDWHRGQLDRQARESQQQQQQQQQPDTDNDDDGDGDGTAKKRKPHAANGYNNNKKKKQPPQVPTQNPESAAWPSQPHTAQSPVTTAWSQTTTAPHAETTLEERLGRWSFYLVDAAGPSKASAGGENNKERSRSHGRDRTLIPLGPGVSETLTSALAGRTVVEFPTVVVLPPPAMLGRRRLRRRGGLSGGEAEGGWEGEAWGGKRARFDAPSLTRTGQVAGAQQVEDQVEAQAEEGEVNSDGDYAMDEAGEVMDVDEMDDRGDETATLGDEEDGEDGEDGEVRDGGGGGGTARGGGLVDYGSDESD